LYDCSLLNHDISAKFWESAQKPPGGHADAARRHISIGPVLGIFGWVAWRWVVFRQVVLMAVTVLRAFLGFPRVLGVPSGKIIKWEC